MALGRREFLAVAAGGVAASVWSSGLAEQVPSLPRFKAVAFDAFPVFDPRPLSALTEALFPGRGADLR